MKPTDRTAPAAQQPWRALYSAELDAPIDSTARHILDLFADSLRRDAAREAIRYFGASLSFARIDALSDAFATWLRERRIGRGDRVGVILQNVPHFTIATLAIWKVGAVPVPGNPMYRADELARIFADYRPAALVCHHDHHAVVTEALGRVGQGAVPVAAACPHDFRAEDDAGLLPLAVRSAAPDFLAICREREDVPPAPWTADADGTALILYTSGTTGVPKGAVIAHASLVINVETSLRWMRITGASRILALAPYFHITGFVLHLGLGIAAGCATALHYRFHPDTVLALLRAWRPTYTVAAITAFNALLNAPAATRDDFASFKQVFTGGAPVAPALRDAIHARLGIDVHPIYGMTETCSPTHICPLDLPIPVDAETGALAVGLPISHTGAKIVRPDAETAAPGEIGEIWVRGPQIMTGYWNKPVETAEALRDGWLRTGDVGVMDAAGWFYVVDRQKDMINASGFKVWPREVEDVLLQHPAVREAAVIGVPDAYRGENVHAFVSLKPGAAGVEEAALIGFCRERLAAYKAPRRIVRLDDLPKTQTGKIQRAVLRDRRDDDEGTRR